MVGEGVRPGVRCNRHQMQVMVINPSPSLPMSGITTVPVIPDILGGFPIQGTHRMATNASGYFRTMIDVKLMSVCILHFNSPTKRNSLARLPNSLFPNFHRTNRKFLAQCAKRNKERTVYDLAVHCLFHPGGKMHE